MSAITTINQKQIKNNLIEEIPDAIYWTTAKIKQIALTILATLFIAGAVAAAFLAPTPFGLLAIPATLIALGVGYAAYRIKDYESPLKLKMYRQEASHLTFKELYSEHGVQNILRYNLLPLPALKEKFNKQVQTMSFSSVLNAYDMDELVNHNVAAPEHTVLLHKLRDQAYRYCLNYNTEMTQCDFRHRNRTDVIKEKVREAKAVVDATAFAAQPDPDRRVDTYFKANAITTPLAFAGELVADRVGLKEQLSYEQEIASARRRFCRQMNHLEMAYSSYKRTLLSTTT